jgi:DNA replication protein DnaC
MSDSLKESLKELRLSAMSERYGAIAQKSAVEKLGLVEYLGVLVDIELEHRYHKRIKKLMRQSKIPRAKNIKDFDLARLPGVSPQLISDLSKGDFIDRAENLLIFGNPGTGKTHLSIALTQEWCSSGRKVLFISAAELMHDLIKSKQDLIWNRKIEQLNKNDVLIIDDISYVPCSREEADLLFILLASRYESKSVVITSNLAFAQWNTIFKDDITTAAAIDRLVHHSTILKLNAESYRKATALHNQNTVEAVMKP